MTARLTFSLRQWRHWRKARWIALAAAVPALWACNARRLEEPKATPTRVFNNVFQETVNRDVDILFMIDNSLSMAPLQAKLTTNFPIFIQVLEGLPGGLPNVHLAVVSSDMGAGPETAIPQCRPGGDNGAFQAVQRGACVSTGLNPNQNYISSVNGMTNFDPGKQIQDVFSCIALLGQDGCGFEHQLESVVHALGADNLDGNNVPQPPPSNANFLRQNAFLSIILITNEDDCSAPSNSPMFDVNSKSVGDSLGPLQSFRCNEFGHLCKGAPPPRTAPASFAPGECVSAEDRGQLIPVSTILTQIKALKTDPTKILVAAIAGPPDPYNVLQVDATKGTADANAGVKWPAIDHSCNQSSGEYADPSIRLKAFIDGFGGNGVFLPICAATFAPALQRIAEEIGKVLGPKCVTGNLVDKVSRDMGQPFGGGTPVPDCTVIDHSFNDAQPPAPIDTVVAACADNGNTAPCWALTDDAMNCPGSKVLSVNRPMGVPLPSGLNSSVACAVCIDGVASPGCPP
jgi:hypothetical protein